MKVDKKKVLTLFTLTLLVASLLFVNMNGLISAQQEEPLYLHGPSLAPIHMNSNITLTPWHMHSLMPWQEYIWEPWYTEWHALYPKEEFCHYWTLTSWEDNDLSGYLSPNDQIDMTCEDGRILWFHVDRMTVTLELFNEFYGTMFVELKFPPDWQPLPQWPPDGTLWHEVFPLYSNVYQCTGWSDTDQNGQVDYCDFVNMTNINTGEQIEWHVDFVGNDIILRWKMMDPRGTWWHEIYPDYCKWHLLTSWSSYPDPYCDRISNKDEIDMYDWTLGVTRWYFVDRVTITINVTYGEPERWMKIELKTPEYEDIFEAFKHPLYTLWHEVYPNYCNVYNLTWWDPGWPEPPITDNCNGVLDPCDHIWLANMTNPQAEWIYAHIVDMTYDLILNERISDPVCTDWEVLYPEQLFGTWYHVDWWRDNNDGLLSPCDYVNLTEPTGGPTETYHVEQLSVTIKLQSIEPEPGYIMYLEALVDYDYLYWPKIYPWGEFWWHEIWPRFSYYYYVPYQGGWEDNCNGVLDYCDNITLFDEGGFWYGRFHVEEVALDMVVVPGEAPPPWYWKPSFPDYVPSGMPDFDERQWGTYNWTDPWGWDTWSHCAPTAIANSLWWLDSEFEPNTIGPPAIIDNFPLLSAYGLWDDHAPQNVQPFIEHLAYLMDTDGQRTFPMTGVTHVGTQVTDMQTGLTQYLSWTGVNPLGDCNGDGVVDALDQAIVIAAMGTVAGAPGWDMRADIDPVTLGGPANNIIDANDLALVIAGMGNTGTFYERTIVAPNFTLIEEEVEKCEDVVLTLGFWYFDGEFWYREDYPYPYGHAVTVAGVNSPLFQIAISDPALDAFETGLIPQGQVPIPHTPPQGHNPPEPPYITHNDAAYVCHDIYNVTWLTPPFPPCPGGNWTIIDYPGAPQGAFTIIENAVITSPLGVHDVAVINVTHSKAPCVPMSTVSQGRTATIWAIVENQGGFTETNFDVTAYAINVTASYVIGTQQVTLNPGQNTTLTFIWDTTGYKNGDYTIEVTAAQVPGETDLADNTFTDGVIRVVTPGDVNGDLCVDVYDKVLVGAAFGSNRNPNTGLYWHGPPDYPGPCPYCPHYANSDLNNDGTIDVFDKVIVGVNFGQGIC